jgi:deoxyribodipyrimidine photo-lyase
LQAALELGAPLVPLFILDPKIWSTCPDVKKNFLLAGLSSLDQDLQKRGSHLIIREGQPDEVLARVLFETGGGQIFAEEDFSPYAVKRDGIIAEKLPITFYPGCVVLPPSLVRKQDGQSYKVFTPFARAWRAYPVNSTGEILNRDRFGPVPSLESLPIPSFDPVEGFPAGEREAETRLASFLRERVFLYKENRDRMDLNGTSLLSPYLRFGMISSKRVFLEGFSVEKRAPVNDSAKSVTSWINELIWREFYINVMYHFPYVKRKAFQPDLRGIQWRKAADELDAWKFGQTGYPIVDAGMRQLLKTGWMHNRARMITASFLVKDLLINWQEGEHWFYLQLIDGDPAANNGGWQWTAGTGTDAAPYFRVFNPVLQSKKFDPTGAYIRKWVPELANVPDQYIHEPWKIPGGSRPNVYPEPIVDHDKSRSRAILAFQRAKMAAKER